VNGPERLLVGQSMGKSFGRTVVLMSATLWCEPGRIGVLIGRNGSGKTTLLRATLGFLRADYGAVRIDGHATERPHPARLARRGVFFSPQQGMLMQPLLCRRPPADDGASGWRRGRGSG